MHSVDLFIVLHMGGPHFVFVERGIYKETHTGAFYERPTINGRRTWRKLDGHLLRLARESFLARRTDYARFKQGLAKNPYEEKVLISDFFSEKLLCGRKISRAKHLLAYFGSMAISDINQKTIADYARWRKGNSKRKTVGRAVELELSELNNIFATAVRRGTISYNPLRDLSLRGHRENAVVHCRDCAPSSAEELHELARLAFEGRKSEVLGWQLLFQAYTGCRTSEAISLRWDARVGSPGHIEGEWLWIKRSKGGVNPFVVLHPDLRELLKRMELWRLSRYPSSPWFFPSIRGEGNEHVEAQSLAHFMKRVCGTYGFKRMTPHGLRSFYVTVRRGQGISDGQIAAEIGDKTGAAIIATTYGSIPPNWRAQKPLSWVPEAGAVYCT